MRAAESFEERKNKGQKNKRIVHSKARHGPHGFEGCKRWNDILNLGSWRRGVHSMGLVCLNQAPFVMADLATRWLTADDAVPLQWLKGS